MRGREPSGRHGTRKEEKKRLGGDGGGKPRRVYNVPSTGSPPRPPRPPDQNRRKVVSSFFVVAYVVIIYVCRFCFLFPTQKNSFSYFYCFHSSDVFVTYHLHHHHTYCLISLSHSTRDTLSVFYAHAHTTFRLLSSDNDAAAAFYRPGGDGDAARRFFVYCRIGAAPPVAFSLPCPTLALFPPRSAHTFHPPPVL